MDERIAKLPAWAREYIVNLQERLAAQAEPLVRELVTLRPRVELLKARNEAMTELLECAAKGGHLTANDIINTIGTYDLVLQERKE